VDVLGSERRRQLRYQKFGNAVFGEEQVRAASVNHNILKFFDHVLSRSFTLRVDLIRIAVMSSNIKNVNFLTARGVAPTAQQPAGCALSKF
jgi:hypothetical protein